MKVNAERISFCLFVFALLFSAFTYGIAVGVYELFPFSLIYQAKHAFDRVTNKTEYYVPVSYDQNVPVHHLEGACPGVNLVTSVIGDNRLSAKIIDMEGTTIHEWIVDWFQDWGSHTAHLRPSKVPKSRPGTHIHGAVVMSNGDIVFNFEELGLIRLNMTGDVVWRLPYQTHHSVHLDENGSLWVCGLKHRDQAIPEYPNYLPPFSEYTVLEVSSDGDILREISIFDLLKRNNLSGLLYMSTLDKRITEVSGDTLHLNDVETFPSDFAPGTFDVGDVMISLRNINTVIVFQRDTLVVKWVCAGRFVRQHDSDFIDGQTISVFDNNNIGNRGEGASSRIVSVSALDDTLSITFEGTAAHRFFTDIMGKHQWLQNGNLLITETMGGRAFEVNRVGKTVWEYINYVGRSEVGIVQEVTRLPLSYADVFARHQSP